MGFTMTAAQMRSFLASHGFKAIGQKGSHLKMTDGTNVTIVPIHPGDLRNGTMRGILSDSGLTVEDAKKWMGRS
jgi:predicted RNA binding protein YcfA (HicA-like mRNA interferase family)